MNGISWGKIILAVAVVAAIIWAYFLWQKNPVDTNTESGGENKSDISQGDESNSPSQQQPPAPASKGTQSPSPSPPVIKMLRVISPNGGDVWQRGKQYQVRWESSLTNSTKVTLLLTKTPKMITDPYSLDARTSSQQFEMFARSVFPDGLSNNGSYNYIVPPTIPTGTYQLLIFAGDKCSVILTQSKCEFDLSDSLFTIK